MGRESFMETDSCKIFVQQTGDVKKSEIIFIHGASLSSAFWYLQLEDKNLSHNFCLYAIDLPGHGKSQKSNDPKNDYTLKGLSNIIAEIINGLSLKKYIIVTASIAGNVIAECVESLKECKGLFITGSSLSGEKFPVSSLILEHPYLHLLTAERATQKELEGYAKYVMFHPTKKQVSMFAGNYQNADPRFRSGLGKVLAESDYSDEVENIRRSKIRLALVYGKEEGIVKPLYLKNAGLDLWKNKIHLIENAGHLVNIENAEVFNKLLYSFAKETLK